MVPKEKWTEEISHINCIHGDMHVYPMADIYLTVGGHTFFMSVALVSKLPYAVILGNDVPIIADLIHQAELYPHKVQVVTHAENFASQEVSDSLLVQAIESQFELKSVRHNMVTTRAQSAQNTLRKLPFFEKSMRNGASQTF